MMQTKNWREANNQMENKVKRRTQELSDTNKMLVKEMEQREKKPITNCFKQRRN